MTPVSQACCSLPANVACGVVILLAEASKTNVAAAQGMARALAPRAADADGDDEEEVFKDAPDSDDERAPQPAHVSSGRQPSSSCVGPKSYLQQQKVGSNGNTLKADPRCRANKTHE